MRKWQMILITVALFLAGSANLYIGIRGIVHDVALLLIIGSFLASAFVFGVGIWYITLIKQKKYNKCEKESSK